MLTGSMGVTLYFLINQTGKGVLPANHYEQQIPKILDYAAKQQEALLSPQMQDELEKVIPLQGIQYQVIDLQGRIIYGWKGESYVNGPEDLIGKLNRTDGYNGRYVKFNPILDGQKRLKGMLLLRYSLNVAANNPGNGMIVSLVLGSLTAPFGFIILFSAIFARRLGRRLEPSITRIIGGAQRIQQNDLNFSVAGEGGSKELTELSIAFEEMRSALEQSLKREWRLEQERRDMISAIAHDLRTPLTIIQGHADNLIENGARHPERLERYLLTIRNSTQRADRMLTELLFLNRIDTPDFILQYMPTDLAAFCERKRQEFDLLCQEKGVRLRYSEEHWNCNAEHIPLLDTARIEQVIDNVMTNGLRFTPAGGEIEWSIYVDDQQITFELKDTGPGFSDQDLRCMFDRFYSGDASRSQDQGQGHSGLGLYTAKLLVEKHGGRIRAGNRPEGGAWVSITVPYECATREAYEESEEQSPA
ncbi:HAMP domain-containing sensor histidine kinase [Paenibacillus sp. D2_2]|uniref:sensor histidine kinase n=1 Tax=Paenibacillus sp. D2_2 TaxID=3073092 RepID=UPI002814C39E|nr:HAMP domain-containing sensor histidine kinase [Paenibacillus sp. D2_2]WMT41252.1 HAMP domain-containing sensor histidine kinase [Paenibacillus sp. D2_2]